MVEVVTILVLTIVAFLFPPFGLPRWGGSLVVVSVGLLVVLIAGLAWGTIDRVRDAKILLQRDERVELFLLPDRLTVVRVHEQAEVEWQRIRGLKVIHSAGILILWPEAYPLFVPQGAFPSPTLKEEFLTTARNHLARLAST